MIDVRHFEDVLVIEHTSKELQEAGIEPDLNPEETFANRQWIPFMGFSGLLQKNSKTVFTFLRKSREWEVVGDVPLHVAMILFRSPYGEQIRANGKPGTVSPIFAAVPLRHEMEEVFQKENISIPEGAFLSDVQLLMGLRQISNEEVPLYVRLYYIGSQEGLNFFVQTLRNNGLVDPINPEEDRDGR